MAPTKRSRVSRQTRSPRSVRAPRPRYVFRFDQLEQVQQRLRTWDAVKGLLGGKGANLAEMTRLGLPVPPGFVITTEACRAYLHADALPGGLWAEVMSSLHHLELASGKRFGDAGNPLLVSCRSGAKFSMPGMMDTVLNIGLNDQTVEGLAARTGNPRFAQDAYRRLLQMFGAVVMSVPDEPFEEILLAARQRRGVASDGDLTVEDLRAVTRDFAAIVRAHAGQEFPREPLEQLRLAIEAVFRSWKGKRAIDYRRAAGIPDDLGTAVNIVTMVFGNRGQSSATGVATTRNVSTGEKKLEGDYLLNAQGEDVVAGIRATRPIEELARDLPESFRELQRIARLLERHHRDVQDIEFTVDSGKLWMLQTRDAKRTARAAVRIAVELAREKLITRQEAVARVKEEHVDFYLHPQFSPQALAQARAQGRLVARGLDVSPGAAVGVLAFDADTAVTRARDRDVVMIRPETKPDDVHGMLASKGILTSRGGRTSHAALVARQFGKPAVVGISDLEVDAEARTASKDGQVVLRDGDPVSLDGGTGEVFSGRLELSPPTLDDPYLGELLRWADGLRRLEVWANADYPADAERARALGAQGIGLCRTEHMFFETERLPLVQRLILAGSAEVRAEMLARLGPLQRRDFEGLFRAMDGLPVTIRLIDPPLHEFLPRYDELLRDTAVLAARLELGAGDLEAQRAELERKQALLEAVRKLKEENPMLGLRGVRLGIHMPELTTMQVRALFEAACACARDGVKVFPRVMIPLVVHLNELKAQQRILEDVARQVMKETGIKVKYRFGTMIEIPRAALTAGEIAQEAQFFSFGTNDLTQTTFGISRDDAETGFLARYLAQGILPENPFSHLDEAGVGKLMALAVEAGRRVRPDLDVGICGEHGGDPRSIELCHRLGLDYVSCSPFRVPVARLAAAHAALQDAPAGPRRARARRR